MKKVRQFAFRYPFVFTTAVVGLVVLVLWFSHREKAAAITATTYVALFVLWTAAGMVKDMLRGHFGLDILALIAMLATLAVGEYGASLVVVLMLSGGEALEDYAAARARSELASLVDRAPASANLLKNPGSPEPQFDSVPVADVEPGDVILVRPGEVVPVDGELLSAQGEFDESSITGESLPVRRAKGEEVLSGTVNGETPCTFRVLRIAADSQYQQIVALVEESEKQKAPTVRVADRFAVPFTILSVLIAGVAWYVSKDPVRFAEVLVLATPCPLLIAAPVAFMGGTSRAAKAGVIMKGGAVLEALAKVRSAGFDKTGTLTLGQPDVVSVEATGSQDKSSILALAAAVEQYSPHVLADAVVRAARKDGLELQEATQVRELPGAGVEGMVGAAKVAVTNLHHLSEMGITAQASATKGSVAAYVTVDEEHVGTILFEDEIRPESAATIAWLRKHGVETIAMFTGDGSGAVAKIAQQAGITDVHAGLKPAEKVREVGNLKPNPSMMVGDGVNDAPALAAASVGIAMGARGATAAGEAADAVIMADSIGKVADAVAISKQTMRVGLTSIWIGIVLSVSLMLVATTGVIPAMAGALTQEFVDLAAILYALRALTGKLPALKGSAS